MKVVTWNIQWGLGCDGRVDLARIVSDARALCDADVFCFQEISHGFTPYDNDQNQPQRLADLLPDHRPVFRPAVDITARDGKRQVFGNMILSRLPVLQVTSHMLPWPATEAKTMQRQGLETIVLSAFGPISITTCHLEFHAAEHRKAQVDALLQVHAERTRRGRLSFCESADSPYRTIAPAVAALICGDFNFEPDDVLHAAMQQQVAEDIPAFVDVWAAANPGMPHPPTAGVADAAQWPGGPHCRDFIFVTENLGQSIVDVRVDTATTASDHQPVAVTFNARTRGD